LLVATGWVLATGAQPDLRDGPLWALALAAAIIVWQTRIHLLWLLGAGAVLGWFGLV
jgi:chromate transporter